ncbi:MAG: hypothetical protein ACSHWW_04835 [Nonlabens sp.]|uniref:hypothetical protein n=1 Tax=Nonlabens sp. TaxID=1888209 RepID=UPI003EF5E118
MSSKKNIDRLFQERFKDFEAAPPMAAWDNIEKELDGKKPVAVLPLWMKWIGIAAGIALLATLAYTGYTNANNDTDMNQQIVTETKNADSDNSTNTIPSQNDNSSNDQFVNSENNSDTELDSHSLGNNPTHSDVTSSSNDDMKSHGESNESSPSSKNLKSSQSGTRTINQSEVNDKRVNNNNSSYASSAQIDNNQNADTQKNYAANASNSNKDPYKKVNQPIDKPKQDGFALDTSAGQLRLDNENSNDKSQLPTQSSTTPVKKSDKFMTPSSSGSDMAAAQVDKDSTITLGPSLEDMAAQQKEKEEENLDENLFKKWNASSVLAPVYSSTMGGSSIDQQFADNNKAAGLNLSYGVNVGYNLTSRLSVRTGIHKVNVSYTTNDIIYGVATQPGDVQLLSVDNYDSNAVSNPGSISTDNLGSSFSQEFLSDNTFNGFQGEISQRLGYLEVPLEMKYKVLDSKLSVNVMGGMSALFLTDNSIAVTNSTAKLELGEDDNFNSFNQSANFGIGIDYLFTDQLGITVEPMFKYQLNALKENTAGFKPFNVGVYSGITYKF